MLNRRGWAGLAVVAAGLCATLILTRRGEPVSTGTSRPALAVPRPRPYEFARSLPSARDYWVEYSEDRRGEICHQAGGRWPIDDDGEESPYHGACARLWIVTPPGLGRPFLVFDAPFGAYTLRRIVFAVDADGPLSRAADVRTLGEIHDDSEREVLGATFHDVDGDRREEVVESHRNWTFDRHGGCLDSWDSRVTYHAWDGTRFRPRYTQLDFGAEQGQLLPVVYRREPTTAGRYGAYLEALELLYPGYQHEWPMEEDGRKFVLTSGWKILFEKVLDLDGDGADESLIVARVRWGLGPATDPSCAAILVGDWQGDTFSIRAAVGGEHMSKTRPPFGMPTVEILPHWCRGKVLRVRSLYAHAGWTYEEIVDYEYSEDLGLAPPPSGAELLARLATEDTAVADHAFHDLMSRNGVDPAPTFGPGESVRLRFMAGSENDTAYLGGPMGAGRVWIFDNDGKLLFQSDDYGRLGNASVADIDGDGLDELVFYSSGGGTGLHVDYEHLLTAQGNVPRDVLCVRVSGYDVNYCENLSFPGHNQEWSASVLFDPPTPDGTVYATVKDVMEDVCECSPEIAAQKEPPRPPETRVRRFVWRRGAAAFKPSN